MKNKGIVPNFLLQAFDQLHLLTESPSQTGYIITYVEYIAMCLKANGNIM